MPLGDALSAADSRACAENAPIFANSIFTNHSKIFRAPLALPRQQAYVNTYLSANNLAIQAKAAQMHVQIAIHDDAEARSTGSGVSKSVGEVIRFVPFVLAFASVSNEKAWRADSGFAG